MSTPVLFEHPLNEKMRTWLRIEFCSAMTVHPPLPAMPMRCIFSAISAIF
jgi:cell division FtsZ-interacting protein ZapD